MAQEYDEATGRVNFVQKDYQSVNAIPYDMPIVGYDNDVVNTLTIWDAEAIQDFSLDSFDKGDYHKAVEQENLAKTIVEVLYPNDNHYEGKELRLKQQYFFISASVQRAVAKYKKQHDDIPICLHPRDHSSPFSSQPNALAPNTAASESFNSDTISFVLPL